ncbi:hypothetical protein [Olleya sp. Bg11-27]|uniref:hypothetical protein n=1 Tax=Olleya sp. Bg11-27 TaxID=2058135 RepID=UPI000C302602|nr:hypothetical protein [Olleya sp. Bg11-27]AUC77447.1 hypothetical protein CW732_17910 [Olleya sp. Bg11-27]
MRTILVTLMILIFIPNTENVIGTYQIVDELNEDTLELNSNGTFTYKERGDSCWAWFDFSGNWQQEKNSITLNHTNIYTESSTDFQNEFYEKPTDSIKIQLVSADKKPLENIEIKYKPRNYKIESKYGKTNSNGIVTFKKFDIEYDDDDVTHISFNYLLKGKEASVSSSSYRNVDKVLVTINEFPKEITEHLEHKFEVENEVLILKQSEWLPENKKYKKL